MMSKQKPFETTIQAMYKRKALDQLLFGYVQGAQASLETISTEEAIRMFYKTYGLNEDEYPQRSARRTVERMKLEYIEIIKS